MAKQVVAYSAQQRRKYLRDNQHQFKRDKLSYRDQANEVALHFGRDKPVSPATIMNDYRYLEATEDEIRSPQSNNMLKPENFPEWRADMFTAPNGKPYITTDYQHALFHVVASLGLKTEMPTWVKEFWMLELDIDEQVMAQQTLFTFVLLIAPRHGKTELILHAIVWLICQNPNIRIVYMQGILSTSQEGMALVQMELETNEKLIDRYGPFKGDDLPWNTKGFIVSNRTINMTSPTMRPVGIDSNIRSIDADLIIMDDPQDLKRASSEVTVTKDYLQVSTELMTRREPHTPVLGVGSHVPSPYGDLWSQIEENVEKLQEGGYQRVIIRKLPAHKDQLCKGDPHVECVLWHELRPYGFLQAQRASLGDMLYSAVYQQNSRPEGLRAFDPDIVRGRYIPPGEEDKNSDGIYGESSLPEGQEKHGMMDYTRSYGEDPKCCRTIFYAAGFDPAAGESKQASESALVVKGICSGCGRRFYIDIWSRKQSPERHPATINSFMRSYSLRRIRIEINAYQKALARNKELKKFAREQRFHIQEWFTDDRKNDPKMGVPNLNRWIKDGFASLPAKTQVDREKSEAYMQALIRYPRKPNDTVMADWLADSECEMAVDEQKTLTPSMMDGSEYLSPHQLDQIIEVNMADVYEFD